MRPEEFQNRWNVSRETFERLKVYNELLVKWQKAINLISPATVSESWNRHFADSTQISGLIPQGAKIADLGSGAGFPGLVLAILRPDIETHLIESDGRKCEFLKNVSRETNSKVTVHNRRVEDVLTDLKPGVITARAFASLIQILEYGAGAAEADPALVFVLLKGKGAAQEIEEARRKFSFYTESIPSKTEQGAQILIIKNLSKID